MSQRDLANPRLFQSAMRVLDAMDGADDCESCRGLDESVLVDAGTLCWAQYFLTTPFDAIAEGPADLTGTFAVLHLVQDLVRAHIGSSLKSLEFLFTCGLF